MQIIPGRLRTVFLREYDRECKNSTVDETAIEFLHFFKAFSCRLDLEGRIGGTLIEKMHLENQVEEYIRNGRSVNVAQEKLYFKDRMKYAWEQGAKIFRCGENAS